MRKQHFIKFLGAVLATSVLAACGGGDGVDFTGGGGGTGGTTGGTPTPTSYKVGYLDSTTTPATFHPGLISVGTASLGVGGQTALRVDIVDGSNARATAVTSTVVFSSNCVAAGRATISPSTVTNGTGRADATYTANGCSGSDTITALVTVGTNTSVTVSGTVTVAAAPIGRIAAVSVTPSVIGLTGSTLTGQSIAKFQVLDQTGNPVSNQQVNFTLSTTAGGLSLNPSSNKTDNGGFVQTVVKAGSAKAIVTVNAVTTDVSSGSTISQLSSGIAVTTGLAVAKSLTVAADKLSLDGSCVGESTNISVRMADRFSNPVPGNTQPVLTTSAGKINGTCTTADPTDPIQEAGVCSVQMVVQNPQPTTKGRAVVLAEVSGEESFVDTNGNGYYDSSVDTFTDLPEPFDDANQNGVYDVGEYFSDTNHNGHWDGPNGKFDGYVCDSPGVNCKSNPTTISNSPVAGVPGQTPLLIVFAGPSVAPTVTVTPDAGSTYAAKVLTLNGANSLATVELIVGDGNGNALPSGTTYSLSTPVGAVLAPATQGPFTGIDAVDISFVLQAPNSTTANPGGLVALNIVEPANGCHGAVTTTWNIFKVVYNP